MNWFQFVSIREQDTVAANEPEESYLTVAEVAATLKLNQQTVRNWIDAGTLPALRVGRRVRIKRSDFDRILEESYSGAASRPVPQPSAAEFWGGGAIGLAGPGDAEETAGVPTGDAPPQGTASDDERLRHP
ncbi:MAG TPA: helix-turn-helix domain-containing protein [Solirubrobacteraceae bacterium]|nr:helix-turn-helix domain-containing protein [Solirubrobacteraceae bacterium]